MALNNINFPSKDLKYGYVNVSIQIKEQGVKAKEHYLIECQSGNVVVAIDSCVLRMTVKNCHQGFIYSSHYTNFSIQNNKEKYSTQ